MHTGVPEESASCPEPFPEHAYYLQVTGILAAAPSELN
jgi:hypothetical protein